MKMKKIKVWMNQLKNNRKLRCGGYSVLLTVLVVAACLGFIALADRVEEKYALTVGLKEFDISPVCESVKLLLEGKVGFEFRTTVVPGYHTDEDITKICEWILGTDKYFIQPFKDSGDILGGLSDTFSDDELEKLLAAAKSIISSAQIRG